MFKSPVTRPSIMFDFALLMRHLNYNVTDQRELWWELGKVEAKGKYDTKSFLALGSGHVDQDVRGVGRV